jgi:hypothetical protein
METKVVRTGNELPLHYSHCLTVAAEYSTERCVYDLNRFSGTWHDETAPPYILSSHSSIYTNRLAATGSCDDR